MAQAIPVSQIVTVNPAAISAGGNALALNAVFLTQSSSASLSQLLSFASPDDVSAYFGSSSTEYALSTNYFNGFDNSTKKPATLFFAGYAAANVGAWLRGQSLAGVTLATLKTVNGTLNVTIDGTLKTGTVNLSAATSFSNAATLIGTAITANVTWDAVTSRFVVSSATTGASSTITQGTGTAAASLGLAAGVLSQGFVADAPDTAMTRIKAQELNWATFMTVFEPTLADKTNFAIWCNNQNARYMYVAWDTDAGYATTSNTAVFGSIVDSINYEGTLVVYNTAALAAFACGWAASIDWNAVNGRATMAFRQQSGLTPTVTSLALANAVLSNNASYFGQYAASGQSNIYNIIYDGRMNGSKFKWADTYINQVFLNSQLQLAMIEGIIAANSVPYNSLGQTFIRSWCQDPIDQALNNGTIRTGVTLSTSQKATINSQAGLDISSDLQTKGYYLQILDATAQVRQARQSPPIKLWYMDGGSIQQITLTSIAVL